ncbi:hypothetical protein P4C99_17095 [Pontiellaceae bacterium B1224]|nr:hypothetical protein [Pontiellaceae bacterium B1224]
MKIISLLSIILLISGCQTAQHTCPSTPQTEKITAQVKLVHSNTKDVSEWGEKVFAQVRLNIYKEGKIVARPIQNLKPNEWKSADIAIDIKHLNQTIKIQIEDEVIEMNSEPGLHLMLKVVPMDGNMVHLKGAYILSERTETNLMKLKEVYSFSAHCKLNEEITLYEVTTQID